MYVQLARVFFKLQLDRQDLGHRPTSHATAKPSVNLMFFRAHLQATILPPRTFDWLKGLSETIYNG